MCALFGFSGNYGWGGEITWNCGKMFNFGVKFWNFTVFYLKGFIHKWCQRRTGLFWILLQFCYLKSIVEISDVFTPTILFLPLHLLTIEFAKFFHAKYPDFPKRFVIYGQNLAVMSTLNFRVFSSLKKSNFPAPSTQKPNKKLWIMRETFYSNI